MADVEKVVQAPEGKISETHFCIQGLSLNINNVQDLTIRAENTEGNPEIPKTHR